MKIRKDQGRMVEMGSEIGEERGDGECERMDKEEEEEVGKTVVVAIKMDQQSKELLTWVLVKVAAPGDRVVALHVLSSSSKPLSDGNSSASSLEKDLESMVAVYEGFCNLKQIDLKLKVCKGSSLRRLLVREVNSFAATQLILGVAKVSRPIGPSPISVAKYCAKKLPQNCSVLAVSNGKIVFQREATVNNKFGNSCWFPSSLSESFDGSKSDPDCFPAIKDQSGSECNDGLSGVSVDEQNCSICAPVSVPSSTDEPKEHDLPAVVEVQNVDTPLNSPISTEIKELAEARSGWPLVRRSIFNERSSPQGRAKVSMVQWAMRLPTRYSTSLAVHSNHRRTKSDSIRTSKCHGESGTLAPSLTFLDKEGRLQELLLLQDKYSSVCKLFSYKELVNATANFCSENLIGKGGSSEVYKGCLRDGEVAVKIIKPSEDAVKEFSSEIEIVTRLHHKNVISLLGFCFNSNKLMLIYDFLSRGSLEEILHGEKENKSVLSWTKRYNVAMGVAEALEYLHCGGGGAQAVIHRDVKSSNILLSEDYEPKLSDFGLATLASASTSHITCGDLAGTFGYLAPEYFMFGRLNEKIDVYAFGVVLLELLSGRKPISSGGPKGQESLVMWAKPILQDRKVTQLMDPGLSNDYNNDQMERMILAASLCVKHAPRSRPPIALILKLLQGDDDTLKWAKSQIGASEDIDGLDGEAAYPDSNLQSHLNLAFLDMEEDSLSASSTEHTADSITESTSLEDDLQGRLSRSLSFD